MATYVIEYAKTVRLLFLGDRCRFGSCWFCRPAPCTAASKVSTLRPLDPPAHMNCPWTAMPTPTPPLHHRYLTRAGQRHLPRMQGAV